MITVDLGQFGSRELEIAAKLLKQYSNNAFSADVTAIGTGLRLCFDPSNGMVFLRTTEYPFLRLNLQNRLEVWCKCMTCGEEGFKSHFKDQQTLRCPHCHDPM